MPQLASQSEGGPPRIASPAARSAYVHVPFCSHRCGYCNFTLISGRDDLIPAYLAALERELASQLGQPVEVDTLFLGGGTPSHLPPAQLEQLLRLLRRWLILAPGGEFSCEANPLDCKSTTLELLQQHGVNRLSLGGQSFHDAKLRQLERDHTGQQLTEILKRCADYFSNISLDLIFAAPDETLEMWQADVEQALASPIRHLSTYGLTIERGSAFYGRVLRHELHELTSELQLAMYEHVIDRLARQAWMHYEVSNFAQPGFHCRHNECYWLGAAWWAFGPGAAGFGPHAASAQWVRTVNHRSPTAYIRKQLAGKSAIAEAETLSLEDRVRERLVFGLRRLAGVAWDDVDALWGQPARPLFEPFISDYLQRGWLEQQANTLRLTRQGLVISDSLWPDLLAPPA